MIRYSLKCADGHEFDSWFQNSQGFETLSKAGQVSCPTCGATDVAKTIMAPRVSGTKKQDTGTELTAPKSPEEAALTKMRDHLEKNSDYVGSEFTNEARRIHLGEAEARGIWGEATKEDAKTLHDEGIPVAPIPWMNRRDD